MYSLLFYEFLVYLFFWLKCLSFPKTTVFVRTLPALKYRTVGVKETQMLFLLPVLSVYLILLHFYYAAKVKGHGKQY